MTELNLEPMKEALSKITPFPWAFDDENGIVWNGQGAVVFRSAKDGEWDDYNFIANAPEWLSSLITTIENQNLQLASAKLVIQEGVSLLEKSEITIEQQRLDSVDKDEHIRALRIAKEHEIECHAKTCFEHQDQIIDKDALIESQKEEIQALSQGYYRKVDAVGLTLFQIKDRKIESLQKDNGYLSKLLLDLRPLLGSTLSEDAVSVAQKEIDFALSHIQEGIKQPAPIESEGWAARKTCSDWNAPGQFRCDCSDVCKEWLKKQEIKQISGDWDHQDVPIYRSVDQKGE